MAFMDKEVRGAWLIHHSSKLQNVSTSIEYENITVAGKSAILLSALSAESEIIIPRSRVKTLAAAARIGSLELPSILDILENRSLIDQGSEEISVLGLTTRATLSHASDIFDSRAPSDVERASLMLSEISSHAPVDKAKIAARLGDEFSLDTNAVNQALSDAEQIGFVDVESLDNQEQLYFNGNLFRRETLSKVKSVLDSLTQPEEAAVQELMQELQATACISLERVTGVLGDKLFRKVFAIGLFDMNMVCNSSENVAFVTLPSSFSKYSSSMIDDAFDLAKAFVCSITYGMTKSTHARGRISMVSKLLEVLIRGQEVGPVQAIAEDYRLLELKGVVSIRIGSRNGRQGPLLRLLKPEVGELALQVIQTGDASEHSLLSLPTAKVSSFKGPEHNREIIRKKQREISPQVTNDMLSALRRGKVF
jgi:hypothetical protein